MKTLTNKNVARKRFTSEKNAKSFAKKVDGKFNDLRDIPNAKSKFSVTYEKTEKTRGHYHDDTGNWCPEDGRDFGYPNEYWQ